MSCRYRYESFPSAEVREYAYDRLYLMVYLGMEQANHVICTLFRSNIFVMMWRRLSSFFQTLQQHRREAIK